MSKMLDLVGKDFGRLHVDSFAYTKNKRSFWNCTCVCGTKCVKMGKYLVNGDTKSCGCAVLDQAKKMGKINIRRNVIEDIGDGTSKIYFNNSDDYTLVDTEDAEWLKDFTWHKTQFGYARAIVYDRKQMLMHDLIMNIWPSIDAQVDHYNRNRLDNRKSNLRITSLQENMKNKSKYKNNSTGVTGIYKYPNEEKWAANICHDGKQEALGIFYNIQDAIKARLEAEKKYFPDRYKDDEAS